MAVNDTLQTIEDVSLAAPDYQSEDEALADIFPGLVAEKATEKEPAKRARDENGKFAAKAKKEDKTTYDADAQDANAESVDTEEPASVPDAVNPREYADAIQALRRFNVPAKTLESLSEQEIVDWGLSIATRQKESDGLGNEIAQLKAKLDKEKAVITDAGDFDLGELSKEFSELLGDEAATKLGELAKKLVTHTHGKTQGRMSELESRLADAMEQQLEFQLDGLRDKWVSDYPALKNRARWELVKRTFHDLPGADSSVESRLRKALLLEFGEETITQLRSNLGNEHEKRANGSPTPPTKREQTAAKSPSQLEDDYANALASGNEDAIRRSEQALNKARKAETYY